MTANELSRLEYRFNGAIRYFDSEENSSERCAIVLLHGLGGALDHWSAVIPVLRKDQRVIALDLPGFGRSVLPTGGLSVENIASDIHRHVADLGVSEMHLVTHSVGVYIGLEMANQAPQRIRRLSVISGTLFRLSRAIAQPHLFRDDRMLAVQLLIHLSLGSLPVTFRTASMMTRSPVLRSLVLRPFVGNARGISPEMVTTCLSGNTGRSIPDALRIARKISLLDVWMKVSAPTNLIWGDRDRLINDRDLEIAGANSVIQQRLPLPGIGHWPMVEDPAAVAAFIIQAEHYE
ncbi:MAG: alpha/beta fold hydrolase [Acidimicrobiales bacterium]